MRIIVQFSGGKDSQAALIQACKEYGANNVTAIFCDTGWEHEDTYKHIEQVVEQLGCKFEVIKDSNVDGFVGLCKRAKWFPDSKKRMCTVQLKVNPMIDYILCQEDDLMIIQGIRSKESESRAKMSCSGMYFSEYFEDSNKKRLYKKRAVLEWCENHKAYVERPLFGWDAQQVIDYILENGQYPNPLYKRGVSRVGCYPCIFSRLREVELFAKDEKYAKRLRDLERDINAMRDSGKEASFFPKGKIPERFCTTYGNGVPAIQDVINYVTRNDGLPTLFDEIEKETSCMSLYHGLCE